MVNMDTWETVLQLKDRVAVIEYELARINKFNPFKDKSADSDKRKKLWENELKKRKLLRDERSKILIKIKELVDENKKKAKAKVVKKK